MSTRGTANASSPCMLWNNAEILAACKKANSYMNPASIVIRYRAIAGAASYDEILAGKTMSDMLLAVIAEEEIALCSDRLSDRPSELGN